MSKAKASQTNSGVTLSRMPDLRHGLRTLGQRAKRSVRRLYDVSRWLDRQQLAAIYLRGEGLEIGALHSPLKVPRAARVRYVDRLPVAELRRQYPDLASAHLVDIDIVDDGEKLSTVCAGTQDFVIANHFLEHCEDPIGAVGNFVRVLRKGGVLYLAVPDKRYTFDIDRPVTPVEHMVKDHTDGPAWSRLGHFEEWVRCVDKITEDAELRQRLAHLLELNYSIHFHVFTQAELLGLVLEMTRRFGFPIELELFLKSQRENVLILRKIA